MKYKIILLALLAIGLIGGASASLTDGLMAYYNFTTNTANYGSYIAAPFDGATITTNAKCIKDECYYMDGLLDYVDTGINFTEDSSFTINGWYADDGKDSGSLTGWLSTYTGTGDGIILVGAHQTAHPIDSIYYSMYESGSATSILCYEAAPCSSRIYMDGAPQMVTIEYNASSDLMYLFINGTQRASASFSSSTAHGSALKLGWINGATTNYWLGYMDEISVWNRALETTEVGSLWNSGTGNFSFYYPPPTPPTTINYFSINNTAGLNTFNASIYYNSSISLYQTTNGTIITNISGGGNANITLSSSGYLDSTYTNWNTTNNLSANFTPIEYFSVYAQNIYDSSSINEFFVYTDNGTDTELYETTTGEIITNIIKNSLIYNLTIGAYAYENSTEINYNTNVNLTENLTALNASQIINVVEPVLITINSYKNLDLDEYFIYATDYAAKIYDNIGDVNGTIINNTNTNYETLYFNASITGSMLKITALNTPHNFSVQLYGYNLNGLESEGQLYDIYTSDAIMDSLGFTFEVGDAKFWFFILISAVLLLLTLIYSGNYIGYVSGLFFFYYFIQLLIEDMPIIYPIIFLMLSLLCIYKELTSDN